MEVEGENVPAPLPLILPPVLVRLGTGRKCRLEGFGYSSLPSVAKPVNQARTWRQELLSVFKIRFDETRHNVQLQGAVTGYKQSSNTLYNLSDKIGDLIRGCRIPRRTGNCSLRPQYSVSLLIREKREGRQRQCRNRNRIPPLASKSPSTSTSPQSRSDQEEVGFGGGGGGVESPPPPALTPQPRPHPPNGGGGGSDSHLEEVDFNLNATHEEVSEREEPEGSQGYLGHIFQRDKYCLREDGTEASISPHPPRDDAVPAPSATPTPTPNPTWTSPSPSPFPCWRTPKIESVRSVLEVELGADYPHPQEQANSGDDPVPGMIQRGNGTQCHDPNISISGQSSDAGVVSVAAIPPIVKQEKEDDRATQLMRNQNHPRPKRRKPEDEDGNEELHGREEEEHNSKIRELEGIQEVISKQLVSARELAAELEGQKLQLVRDGREKSRGYATSLRELRNRLESMEVKAKEELSVAKKERDLARNKLGEWQDVGATLRVQSPKDLATFLEMKVVELDSLRATNATHCQMIESLTEKEMETRAERDRAREDVGILQSHVEGLEQRVEILTKHRDELRANKEFNAGLLQKIIATAGTAFPRQVVRDQDGFNNLTDLLINHNQGNIRMDW